MQTDPARIEQLYRIGTACAFAAITIGATAMAGWITGLDALKSVVPGLITMKANTALTFIVLGTGLFLLRRRGAPPSTAISVGYALAGLALVVAAAVFSQYIHGHNLGVDEFLFEEPPGAVGTVYPGRMALNTSVCFLVASLGALLIRSQLGPTLAPVSGLVVSGAGLLALIGYATGVTNLYGIANATQMAVPTAAGFVLLGASLIAARPDAGPLRLMASEGPGGALVRGVLPLAIAGIIVLTILRLAGQAAGLYDTQVGTWLLVSCVIGFLIPLVWQLAGSLETSDRRTRQILETANDAFISIDARGVVIDWNPQAEITFGWSCEEAKGRDLREMIVPESHREAHWRGLENYVATGEGKLMGQVLKLPALHRDGREFPIELTLSPLQTAEGWSFNAFARDISEREAAEQLLERQRRQLIEAQSIGQFGSWEWDVASDTIEWSDQLCRIFGIEPGAGPATFGGYLKQVHPDDRVATKETIEEAYEAGEPFSFEHRIVHPDGSESVIHARGEVVLGSDGKPVRMLGTGEDITERREVERAKDEFTSVVSHELRTPLTSIRGSLGLLESGVLGPLPEKGQRMIEIAVENTDRLVRLINDILDIERIDSGKIDMQKGPCDGAELIKCAVESLESLAANAGIILRAETAPVAISADRDRIHQTLTNLISNAVKFSPAGSVVEVSCAQHGGEVVFSVTDEGRGIPADKLDSIFERFQQVDASDSREKGGTGLGLAICRTIVENHDGRIWVESKPGEGSTFSFALPAPVERDLAYVNPDASNGPTVLVCDDDAKVVEVVGTMLEQRGYGVVQATSGLQALELATSGRPDVILLDLQMPGMSGWEIAAALGEKPETRSIPIIALTVLAKDQGKGRDAPFFQWLEKPVDEQALFAAIEGAIAAKPEPFRVLVVEDDRDLAGVLTATMESDGIEAYVAADGQQAIELSQRVVPHLLVLDVGLPEADGFEVVDWLRRHEQLNALPMIVYTARNLDEEERDRLRLGRKTEFLLKGEISPEDFQRRVLRLLARPTQTWTPERKDEPEAHPVGR